MKKRENVSAVHVTTNMTGKMEGMCAITTACTDNERCERNAQIPGSICQHCYAKRQFGFQPRCRECFERNGKILKSRILNESELPEIHNVFCRIESHGDIANVTHAINYLNIVKANPQTTFGWWTKNPDLIAKALKKTGMEKPENLIIVRSSMFVNKPIRKGYAFVDKVFTVYDKNAIAEKGVDINCGARNCFKCRKCYTKNDLVYINEKLK